MLSKEGMVFTHYRHHCQCAPFGDKDLLNFAVNIYDEGNVLSIVCDCGTHGADVTEIVAAKFPDQPD